MKKLVLAFASLALAGCNALAPATPEVIFVTPPPTASPAPTATPTAAPTASPTPIPTATPAPSTAAPPTASPSEATACGPVESPQDQGNDHLDPGQTFDGYVSNPPTSGPHSQATVAGGQIYQQPQAVEELVHSMEHGMVVFWTNGLDAAQQALGQQAFNDLRTRGAGDLIWLPYPELDAPFAMTAWGKLQKCSAVDARAMESFVSNYYGSGVEGLFACPQEAPQLPLVLCGFGGASPGAGTVAELLEHVPQSIRATCTEEDGTAVGAVVAVACTPEGITRVAYYQFASKTEMDASYEGTRDALDITSDTGDCSTPREWPGEYAYNISDQPAGRVLCAVSGGRALMDWTDDRLNIEAFATLEGGDAAALYEFWKGDSGPNL